MPTFKIPAHNSVVIYSDSAIYIDVPSGGAEDIEEAPTVSGTETYFAADYFSAAYFT